MKNILENEAAATLRLKASVLCLRNEFFFFLGILSDEVENIFWENRRFQIFSHQKILRMTILENGFEASVRSKINFASILAFFLSVFLVTKLKAFSGKAR